MVFREKEKGYKEKFGFFSSFVAVKRHTCSRQRSVHDSTSPLLVRLPRIIALFHTRDSLSHKRICNCPLRALFMFHLIIWRMLRLQGELLEVFN